jgi:hypothetical protein
VREIPVVPWHGSVAATLAAHREPRDDFFCLRYRVWYPSVDCAYRTLYRTCPGCRDCDQGRFNLKRHRATLLYGRPWLRRGS